MDNLSKSLRKRRWLLACAMALPLAQACGRKPKGTAIASGSVVLALGDSITAGVGATAQTSYPVQLAKLTGWNVVNGGISGDKSADAVARLPALLEEHKPKLVIVSIGGNDFLRGVDEATTRANMAQIIRLARSASADVLLVAVPKPSALAVVGALSDHPMYAEIAKAESLPLIEGAWSEVLGKSSLKSDPIHANAEGYKVFAELMVKQLRKLGLAA